MSQCHNTTFNLLPRHDHAIITPSWLHYPASTLWWRTGYAIFTFSLRYICSIPTFPPRHIHTAFYSCHDHTTFTPATAHTATLHLLHPLHLHATTPHSCYARPTHIHSTCPPPVQTDNLTSPYPRHLSSCTDTQSHDTTLTLHSQYIRAASLPSVVSVAMTKWLKRE